MRAVAVEVGTVTGCKFCGGRIAVTVRGPMEQGLDGKWIDHDCPAKEKRAEMYAKAKREAKAEGFHGAALDNEIRRRVYGPA